MLLVSASWPFSLADTFGIRSTPKRNDFLERALNAPYIGTLAHGRPLELPPRNSGFFVADIESEAAASTLTTTPRIKTARLICPASPGEDGVG